MVSWCAPVERVAVLVGVVGLCGASVLHYPTAMVMAGRCRELGRWRGGVLQHDLVPGVVRSWCCGVV